MSAPNDDRDLIFRRIREAIRIRRENLPDHGDAERYRQLLPPVRASLQARIELFREWSDKLNTRFIAANPSDWRTEIASLAAAEGWKSSAFHGTGLAREATEAAGLPAATALDTTRGYDPERLEACDVGFTDCEALVAQTGSVLLTSRGNGGRALSVLPPHHVVIATAGQMVPDLLAAMALIRERHGAALPSLVTLHTGPSRTGDIERQIVLGAHGPKKLTVILILD